MSISIKRSEFTQNILKMFTGAFLSQIIIVIGSLVLARLYSPEQFGELSLFISIVSIFSILATVRYENSLIVAKYNYELKYIKTFLYIASTLFSLAIFLLLLVLDTNILVYFKIENFYILIPLMILVYALSQIFTNLNVKDKSFKTIANSKIWMAFFALALQVIFYYLDLELGLIYGYTIGYIVAAFILYKNIYNPFPLFLEKKRIITLLTKYSYFFKHGLPADFINNLATNITPILIAIWFDMQIAGLYFLGYRIINLPLQLISASVGKVYFQKASEMYHHNSKDLYYFTKKIVVTLFLIISLPLLILFFYAPEILGFILGQEWSESGVYISLLTVMFLFRTMFSPISNIAEVTQKVYISLYFSVFILVTTIISLYIGHLYSNFNLAILLISLFGAYGYFMLLVYFLRYLKGVSK
ncbi:MAG TPA: hypothetical protein EYG73_10590 [Arcobacter sp.]|nr:hypothetical protein [Arcobacter sp.]